MSAIAKVPNYSAVGMQQFITPEKLTLIKEAIMKGANDTELELFVDVCNRTRLDPFARQIFAVPRWDANLKKNTYAFQISIDGFRLIAERSGQYAGQTEAEWCGPDGVWKTVWLSDEPPAAARIGVFRHGFQGPLYAIAKYKNYVQTNKEGGAIAMWKKMPDHMLAKCCEALALRKAFPQDLSGLYAPEEMAQAGEKTIQGTESQRQPLERPKTVEAVQSQRSRIIGDVRASIQSLRELGDQVFIASTDEERQAQVIQAVHAFALEYDLQDQYKTLQAVKELSDQHLDQFAGWLEGRIAEVKEKAIEGDDVPI